MRLFISLNLPPELYGYLRDLQENFPGLKKTREFHLTLQFLGDGITKEQKDKLMEALNQVAFDPFEVTLSQVTPFGPTDQPRGVWVDCLPNPALEKLVVGIQSVTRSLSFEPDKLFKAHITLGRYKRRPKYQPKTFQAKKLSFHVDRFYLMRSHLSEQGSEYEVVGEFGAD